jgi:hypothetical protein
VGVPSNVKRLFGLVSASAMVLACGAANKTTNGTPVVFVAPPPRVVLPSVPPAPDDPARDWHTYSPKAHEGGPFYRVVDLNVTAPSVYGGSCSLERVDGAMFLSCGSLARVDGARLDASFPSPSTTTTDVVGRYPDDLWARTFEGTFSDGYEPPKDVFRESDHQWFHYENGKWKRYSVGGSRHPYLDKGSLFFVMPPVTDPKAAERPKSCADYSCLRVLPRVVTTTATKPDFSSLSDKITWLHHHDETEWPPDDFAFVVDETGPVYVFMRAMDVVTKKKGFGVARWTPSLGASFEWLPFGLAAKKTLSFSESYLKDGKVRIAIAGDATMWIEGDGRTWKQIPPSPAPAPPAPEAKSTRFFAHGSEIKERLADGSERTLEGFASPHGASVVTVGDDDAWVFTDDGVYRTIRPPEVLYRTEAFGALHPFPKPLAEGEDCATPFAIFDSTAKHRAEHVRRDAWKWQVEGAVEFEVHGELVVGAPVKTVADGEKLLEATQDAGYRLMQGTPHHLVCARPFGATPFVPMEREEPEGD